MKQFLAGATAGVLIERYHIIGAKPEGRMADFLYIALIVGAFGFMAWAIRALRE
jgi:hypothetical protein